MSQRRESLKELRSSYLEFLKSNYWSQVRKQVLNRDNFCCQACGAKESLQVHHLTYKHHKREHRHLEDLITLCRVCHEKAHAGKLEVKPSKKQRTKQLSLQVEVRSFPSIIGLPKLKPIPVREEDEPSFEKEIWQPKWNCFCCQDTGIVTSHLVRLVIPDYNWDKDALPVCQHPNCHSKDNLSEVLLTMLDYRISPEICQQLDQISREDWKQTVQIKQETLQQLANSKSLRQRARTQEEEQIAHAKQEAS